jgi:hypothetical protein
MRDAPPFRLAALTPVRLDRAETGRERELPFSGQRLAT